ncbi:methyltransferase [Kaistia dalseonensis]|uniref:methyltransferase n=1 Tax=Kaistia dalseonensis TaxID=410840 RepID=UPI003F9C71C0
MRSTSPESEMQSAPSPAFFIETVMAYQKTAAIKAAVDLGLFSAIGAGADTADRLASETGAARRGVEILADYLAVLGFLTKAGGRYGLTPSSAVFLDRKSPAYLGGVVDFLASPEMTGLLVQDPAAFVRNGGSVGLANMAPDNPVWIKFAAAMMPMMAPSAEGIAARVAAWPHPPRKVLDIAAGHGRWGIAVGRAVPGAEIVAVDWREVLKLAERNAAEAGLGTRYRTIPGSAFDVDWGTGYDLILVPHFLHHFDAETCAGLLRKVRGSLAPGGQVLVIENVIDEDGLAPPWPAAFSFLMLGTTPHGKAYTAREYEAMGRAAGFSGLTIEAMPPAPHSLLVYA